MKKEKENENPAEKEHFYTMRVHGPIEIEGYERGSIYGTPRRPIIPFMGSSSKSRKTRAFSVERSPSPVKPHRRPLSQEAHE